MKWFKHSTRSGSDYRVLNMMEELGLSGYGMYNMILEMMYGQRQREKRVKRRVLYTFCRGRFYRSKMDRLIDGFGLFRVDAEGWVTPVDLDADDDTSTTVERQHLCADSAVDAQHPMSSNARAYIETEKKTSST